MPIIRDKHIRNYCVISNIPLQDRALTLKAKGLLAYMLSLPEDWRFSVRGLARTLREGEDAIRTTLLELEAAGYVQRQQQRTSDGRMGEIVYYIYEIPPRPEPESPDAAQPRAVAPAPDLPDTVLPDAAAPAKGNPCLGKAPQKNTKQHSTVASNTQAKSTYGQIPYRSVETGEDAVARVIAQVKEQVEYDVLAGQYMPEQVDELVGIMAEVQLTTGPAICLGRGRELPASFVKGQFAGLQRYHLEMVLDKVNNNTAVVHNSKAYLQTLLYNESLTLENETAMQFGHDYAD